MSNPMFLSSTPPPMDDFDDDLSGFETTDVTFNNYDETSLPSTPRALSKTPDSNLDLPIPDDDLDLPNYNSYNKTTIDFEITLKKDEKDDEKNEIKLETEKCDKRKIVNNTESLEINIKTDELKTESSKTDEIEIKTEIETETIKNLINNRNESPPSLILSHDNYSDNDFDDESLQDNLENENSLSKSDSSSVNQHTVAEPPEYQQQQQQQHEIKDFELNQPDNNDIVVTNDVQPIETNFNEEIVFNKTETEIDLNCDENESLDDLNSSHEIKSNSPFVADFSQFGNFESCEIVDDEIKDTITICDKNYDDEDYDDDDDFDDFQDFSKPIPPTTGISEPKTIDDDEDDDDDDFGDFNDFKQAAPQTVQEIPVLKSIVPTALAKPVLNTDLKSMLDSMFPILQENDDLTIKSDEMKSEENNILKNLKEFDTGQATKYQWSNSNSNQSLLGSLGIDSRNILFGGNKWNNSMPRFASNLGFTPLEPLKSLNNPTSPTPIMSTTFTSMTTPTMSSSSNSSSSNFYSNPIISSSIPSTTSTLNSEVPAVQFDWNSSGLVNPLDASQAHTLLLDLEQLVVVANLDKIKLDSSSCSSSSATVNLSASSSSALPITTTTTKTTILTSNNTNNLFKYFGDGKLNTTLGGGGGVGVGDFGSFGSNINKTKHIFDPFDNFLEIRVQKELHEKSNTQNNSKKLEITRKSSIESAAIQSIQSIQSTKPDIEIQLTNISSDKIIQIPEKQSIETVIPTPHVIIPSNLRETHIFTPNKSSNPISREVSIDKNDVAVVVVAAPAAAAAVIDDDNEFSEFQSSSEIKIDKNVITKEYRDVEYDPEKLKISKSISPTILQPIKIDSGSITINWPEPGNLSKSYNIDSDRFDSYATTSAAVAETKPIEKVQDFEFTEFHGTNTVKYEPDDDEFTNFQGGLKINNLKYSKPIVGTSPTPPIEIIKDDFDDEFTDFQSVTPVIVPNGFNENHKKTNSILPPSINPSPPITLVPNILVPENKKIMTIEQPLAPTKINWPDPGVDMDEIARIEAAFAHKSIVDEKPVKKSTTDDDDWSDFVSVKTENPTSVAKPIVTKPQPKEDDDWSDFVSSTTNQWNNNSSQLVQSGGPNFSSWNMPPPQFNSWNNTNLFQTPINQQTQQQPQSGYLANLNNGLNYGVNNQTSKNKTNLNQKSSPSISILPDLGFVAPKTIMNIPKGNFNKK